MAGNSTPRDELAEFSDLAYAFHLEKLSDEIANTLDQGNQGKSHDLSDQLFAAVGEAVERVSVDAARVLLEYRYADHGAGAAAKVKACLEGIEERAALRKCAAEGKA